jgi:hypothetical protein
MLRKRLDNGLFKYYYRLYRNPYFLVKKKEANSYRLIFAAMLINAVTIRDANLPSRVDNFAKEFARIAITLLLDLFSRYN